MVQQGKVRRVYLNVPHSKNPEILVGLNWSAIMRVAIPSSSIP